MAGVLIFVFLAILIFGLAGLLIFGLAGVCGSGAGQHGVVPVLSAGGPAAPGQRGGRPSHRTLRLQPSHRPSLPQKPPIHSVPALQHPPTPTPSTLDAVGRWRESVIINLIISAD